MPEQFDRREGYHPSMQALNPLSKLRPRKHESDKFQSTARFVLPFPVETHLLGKYNLWLADCGALVIYVDLKAHDDEHCVILLDENSIRDVLNYSPALLCIHPL